MTDTFFALYCICVSDFFFPFTTIILTAISGFFFPINSDSTLSKTLEMGEKKNNQVLHFPAYKFTENVLQKMLETTFLRPY